MLALITEFVEANGITYEEGSRDGELVVSLPGEKKLKTVVSLLVTESELSLSAFVIRNADENHEEFYRFLLRRNLRLPGVAYAVDRSGDVYLTGRFPAAGIDTAYLDQLFGVVLEASDTPFNELLAIGFLTSMRKEWDWRVSRGESLRNLEAFRPLLERDGDPSPS